MLKVPLSGANFAGLNSIHRPPLQAFAFSIVSTLVFTRCSSRTLWCNHQLRVRGGAKAEINPWAANAGAAAAPPKNKTGVSHQVQCDCVRVRAGMRWHVLVFCAFGFRHLRGIFQEVLSTGSVAAAEPCMISALCDDGVDAKAPKKQPSHWQVTWFLLCR